MATDHKEMIDNLMPFLLDKMSSTTHNTKIECMDVVTKIIQKFEHGGPIKDHLEVAVSTIQNDYYNIIGAEI